MVSKKTLIPREYKHKQYLVKHHFMREVAIEIFIPKVFHALTGGSPFQRTHDMQEHTQVDIQTKKTTGLMIHDHGGVLFDNLVIVCTYCSKAFLIVSLLLQHFQ